MAYHRRGWLAGPDDVASLSSYCWDGLSCDSRDALYIPSLTTFLWARWRYSIALDGMFRARYLMERLRHVILSRQIRTAFAKFWLNNEMFWHDYLKCSGTTISGLYPSRNPESTSITLFGNILRTRVLAGTPIA